MTRVLHHLVVVTFTFVSASVLSACSVQIPTPSSEPAGSSSVGTSQQGDSIMASSLIEVRQMSFAPVTLTVKPGELIAVTNRDSVDHTVTSDQTGAFDTGVIAPGETVTFAAPLEPGTYNYICTLHPDMKAQLIVREGL